MKVRICIVVIFLMCFASVGLAKQFTDNEYGYTITIPDAWNEVPIHNDDTLPEERYSCNYIDEEKKLLRSMQIGMAHSVTSKNVSTLYDLTDYEVDNFSKQCSENMENKLFAKLKKQIPSITWIGTKLYRGSNNIWVICNMKAYYKSGRAIQFVSAETIIKGDFMQLFICYMGDEENVETVFQQIMGSVKPL